MKVYAINAAARELYRELRRRPISRDNARLFFVGMIRVGVIGGRVAWQPARPR